MIDLRTASLVDFLPESIASDEDIVALSLALDPELQSVGAAIIEAVIWPNIDNLSEPVLNELGWACRLNELELWDSATVAGKRNILRQIFKVRKRSGTRWTLERVFGLLGVTALITEWWEESPKAAAFTFKVRLVISDVGMTYDIIRQIPELVHRFARATAVMREYALDLESPGTLYPYPALTVGRLTTIPFGGP